MKIAELKQFLDKRVILRMSDGEVATVRVDFVDEEYEDIIADVLETTRPEHYRVPDAAYTFAAADIVSAEVAGEAEKRRAR